MAEAIRPGFGEERSRATAEGSAGSGEEGGDITDVKVGAVSMDEEPILHKAALLAAEAGFQPGREGDGKAPCRVVHCGRDEKHEFVLEDGSVYAKG